MCYKTEKAIIEGSNLNGKGITYVSWSPKPYQQILTAYTHVSTHTQVCNKCNIKERNVIDPTLVAYLLSSCELRVSFLYFAQFTDSFPDASFSYNLINNEGMLYDLTIKNISLLINSKCYWQVPTVQYWIKNSWHQTPCTVWWGWMFRMCVSMCV